YPARAPWPKWLALLAVGGIVAWMAWALANRAKPSETMRHVVSPVSARARRDQIVKAIEVLDRDLQTEKIKPKKYERRHAELMHELAEVLHEIELAGRG